MIALVFVLGLIAGGTLTAWVLLVAAIIRLPHESDSAGVRKPFVGQQP